MVRPSRLPQIDEIFLPTTVDPVTENSGILGSAAKLSPITEERAMTRLNTPSGTLFFLSISLIIIWVAMAVKGVLELGFHTTISPATAAIIAFHAHTATGKLNALTTATIPSG